MKKILLVFVLVVTISDAFSQKIKYSKVSIDLKGKNLKEILSKGVDLEGCQIKKDNLIGIFSTNDIERLKKIGFDPQIIIEDMSQWYIERNKENRNKEKAKQNYCNTDEKQISTPLHFKLGSVGGFLSLTELYSELDSMAILYPNLITVKQPAAPINTIEGRPVYFVKISDNPEIDENEPEVLYTALTHAREPAGMQQLVFFMWYLLENYSTDPEIKYIVDNSELYFIPCVNPDGYQYNITTSPNGGGLHRKNMRVTGAQNLGVDLNRNFGFMWGYDDNGSSPNPEDDTYRGTGAFSEPETQIIKHFCENRNISTCLNYHCYSNLLIMPFGFVEDSLPADSVIYKEYAKLLTSENGYLWGTPNQTVFYVGNGVADDWMYGEQVTKPKIISFTPEAGDPEDGFWPQYNRIEDICKINLKMNLYLALVNLKYAKFKSIDNQLISNLTDYVRFSFKYYGTEPGDINISIIPLTSNINSVGSPKNYPSLTQFTEILDSIQINLTSNINPGDEVKYVIVVDNGYYQKVDTIKRIFGIPVIAFFDPCDNMNNWYTTSTWNTTTTQYYSPPTSITDSPYGYYSNNVTRIVTLRNNINLTGAAWAQLNFYAKWDIEKSYDYVQILVSDNNGISWSPLCGKYTVLGNNNQALGEPLYDGKQLDWVKEEISLNDYLGKNIKIRFMLKTDAYVNEDGFYFDDLSIIKIDSVYTNVNNVNFNSNSIYISEPIPNPTEKNFRIDYDFGKNKKFQLCEVKLYNTYGINVKTIKVNDFKGSVLMDCSGLSAGIYFVVFSVDNEIYDVKKLVLSK